MSFRATPTYHPGPHGHLGQHVAAHKAKLNGLRGGGATLLVATIEQLTGLPIDHYLEVNFDASATSSARLEASAWCCHHEPQRLRLRRLPDAGVHAK